MEFALESESTESLQETLAFIDETLDDSSSINSHEINTKLSPLSDDWETSHLLDDLMTDISSDGSSPQFAVDPATPAMQSPTLHCPNSIVTLSFNPKTPNFESLSTIPTFQHSPLPMVTRKKRRSYNPNKARDDLKRELMYLRSEAEELEFKLHQLENLKVAKTKDNSSASDLVTSRLPVGQIQVAKSLEKLLSKRTTLYPAESSGSRQTTRIQVSRKGNEVTDAAVFEELADGVQMSYNEVEHVFASSGLDVTNVSSRKAQVCDGKNGMFLEIFDSKILPFSIHATESTDDTIVEHFGMEMSDTKAKTTAKFYVQQILRRYNEEDRVVVVWQSHIEPLEFSHKKLAGIRFREKGYVVIKPHQVAQDETYTLVQTCHIIKPDLSDQRLKKDARTGALAEFVLSVTVANIAAGAEMIEGLLVDEALQQRSRM
ncbi:M96 mating-specific protein family [Phytophthora palmivora]|uniref:M96 mating-specific protein family n=1 Tax=Phytophthora palmivora TaxID=4796 RepID=A0A2P4Y187_9STRA|nr:M96 mating-specific protein family [Phytophthora palmivora]